MLNIGFIGTGNMGSALIKGIANSEMAENLRLHATDEDRTKLSLISKHDVVMCENGKEVVEHCKYVFIVVKPQGYEKILKEIAPYVTGDTVLISIGAGITGDYIKSKTNLSAKVILAMPNTPTLLGEGATAVSRIQPTTDNEFKLVKDLLSACGKVATIPSDKMKEIIAINGSSPAFIYLFAKGFVNYATSVGINEDEAKLLFSQTLVGSARMITDTGSSIDDLISSVSSPGGTTVAGLKTFEENDLIGIITKVCEDTTKRAYELSL